MELKKLNRDFSVCKVKDYSHVNLDAEYLFIGKTDEERSIVCATEEVPDNVIQQEDGWQGFRIQGNLDFALVGILSKISAILADHCSRLNTSPISPSMQIDCFRISSGA